MQKQDKYYYHKVVITLCLGVAFLISAAVIKAAWTEPTQAPPGGNVARPIYVKAPPVAAGESCGGTVQCIRDALTVGSRDPISATLAVVGLETTALRADSRDNDTGGDRAVYGLATDNDDYAGYFDSSASNPAQRLAVGIQRGFLDFLSRDYGIRWPRQSDGMSINSVFVDSSGQMRISGLGGGIKFTDQNDAARLTINENGLIVVPSAGGAGKVAIGLDGTPDMGIYELRVNGEAHVQNKVKVRTGGSYCFGDFAPAGEPAGKCVTAWWGADTDRILVPLSSAIPDAVTTICPEGYTMIGIKNGVPADLVCQKIMPSTTNFDPANAYDWR